MNSIHPLIIIGSGPAGLTAAIYASRANLSPVIIEGTTPGGQLMGTSMVENWPGEKQIMGPKLMINMREQAAALGTTFVAGSVESIDLSQRPFTITTTKNTRLQAHAIIIATGASPLKLGCPGEETYWGRGVSTCAICDAAFYKGKGVVIVGGGDTAMEDASFLAKFTDNITIIHIKDKLTASPALQERVLKNKKITIVYSSTVTEIQGDGSKVTAVVVENKTTGKKNTLATDGVFIAIGLRPNTDIFKGQLKTNAYGYLSITDETKTSHPGVFAAGDVFDDRYRQAITAAGSGCKASLDAQRYLETIL